MAKKKKEAKTKEPKKQKKGMFGKKNTVELDPVNNVKDFLDMNLPGMVKFYPSYLIQDGIYRTIWAIRSYPTTTNEQALLANLGEKAGVTLHVITEQLTANEEAKIISSASNRNKAMIHSSTDTAQNIGAQEDLNDVVALIRQMHHDKESLFHTTVFIEISASSLDELENRKMVIASELKYLRINVDELILRQEQGFLSVFPGGRDKFRDEFSRALPEKSVANLFPFSYSGKNDPHGFMVGKDRNGSYIITDLDKKDNLHTNSNVLVLGNSGQGKSYLVKGLIINLLEQGKNIIILDPEHEYEDLVRNLGGNYLDLMDGDYMINILEPKTFTTKDDDTSINDDSIETGTFRTKGSLSQHISFLRDFFRQYKDLNRAQLDILEIILSDLYESMGITNETDMKSIPKEKFPTMSDLWAFTEDMYNNYSEDRYMFTKENLRDIRLAIESVCKGSQARYFDGHTNIKESKLLAFGMKGVMDADESLRNAMLFNTLSYMSDKLLVQRNTAAILDEFYLFLSSQVSVEYTRNCMKRVRKCDSMMIIESQNLEDFLRPEIESYTKPLFSIPTHRFLFNPGAIDQNAFVRTLQLEPNEYRVIQYPQRGLCLYCCGTERYSLMVEFPEFKTKLFGNAGGR